VKLPFGKSFVAVTVAAMALFMLFPGLDLTVSGLFYRDGAFYLRDNAVVRFLYEYGELPAEITAAAALLLFVAAAASRRSALLGCRRRVWLYLFLAAIIGPGLIVNTALKDHLGRARPLQIQEFGGDRQFTVALAPADQCPRNCSFPCGHCAAGFYFLSIGFVATGRARRAALAAGLLWGAALSSARLVQGGHFLSDAVFALIIVYAVSAVLHWLMFRVDDII